MSGSDAYVRVPEVDLTIVSAGRVSGRNFITENVDQQQALIAEMHTKEIEALESLNDQLSMASLPDGWEKTLTDVSFDALTLIERGTTGDAPTLTLPDDWPTNIPILGVLKETPTVDLDIVDPTKPDAPTRDINYTESSYDSIILEDLYTSIYNGLGSKDVIFSEEVQALMLEQGQARQKTVRDYAYQQAVDGIGSDGFDLTGGAEAGILGMVTNQALEEDSALNRDVTIKMAELADLNVRFMTDKALTLEQLARDFHNNKENRSLEAEKTIATFLLSKYDTAMKAYAQEWDGEKTRLLAATAKVDTVYKQNQTTIDAFKGELDGKQIETDIVKSKTDAVVSGYQGEVEGYKAELQEKANWWDALTKEQQTVIAKEDLKLKQAIAEVEALLGGTLSDNKLKAAITNDIASIVAQIIASALGSVNTGVTHSTSRSETANSSVSSRASITTSHSYDETKLL